MQERPCLLGLFYAEQGFERGQASQEAPKDCGSHQEHRVESGKGSLSQLSCHRKIFFFPVRKHHKKLEI